MTISLYERYRESAGGHRATGLLERHRESLPDMFEVVFHYVEATIPSLVPEKRYTAEQLCGPELWAMWPHFGQRCSAGLCLAFCVEVGALPLEKHETKSGSGTNRYFVPLKRIRVLDSD
jgi:hypothetical protein